MLDLKKYEEFKQDDSLSEDYSALKDISVPELFDFVVTILNEHGDKAKLENANKVHDVLKFILTERNLYVPGQSFLNILIAACLLHNIVDIKKWNDVFKIREMIEGYDSKGIPYQAIESICDTIEGQLGEGMPIKGCRPNPNTPGELFTLAVALTNRYI